MAQRVGHTHHLSTCYVHLTELYLQMEDYPRAIEYGKLAETQIKQLGGSEFMFSLLVYTGMANLGLGNMEIAQSASREALKLLKEKEQSQIGLDDQAGIFQLFGQIAQAEKQYDRAKKYYEHSFEMLEKSNRPLPAARLLLTITRLLIEQSQLDQSLVQNHQAEVESRRISAYREEIASLRSK